MGACAGSGRVCSARTGPISAAHVSQLVKALAELLTEQSGKNQYQGIFGELYQCFGVSRDTLIRIEQYAAVLAVLEQWRETALHGAR
ncbi:MAG: hypothetical protein HC911_18205 [Chloroflexaceae bacterium]|nr:hypothetical protein [Chloroflexaceae bacterium]